MFSVIFTLPISYTIVMFGYTYAQVFQSKLHGFLLSTLIVYFGSLAGGVVSFLISRYLLKEFVKE